MVKRFKSVATMSIVLAASASLAAGPSDLNPSQAFSEMLAKLEPIAQQAGILPTDMRARFIPLLNATMPKLSEAKGQSSGYRMEFNTHQAVAIAGRGLEAEPNGWRVLLNPAACASNWPNGGKVVQFRSIATANTSGFVCVQADSARDGDFLVARMLIEGVDRRWSGTYIAGASATGDRPGLKRAFIATFPAQRQLVDALVDVGGRALNAAKPG